MSTHGSRYAVIIDMKQSSRDKCAISVKVSSEFWTSSIVIQENLSESRLLVSMSCNVQGGTACDPRGPVPEIESDSP